MGHLPRESVTVPQVKLAPAATHLNYLCVIRAAATKPDIDDKLKDHEDVRLHNVVLVSRSEKQGVEAVVLLRLELPDVLCTLFVVKGINLDSVADELLLDRVVEGDSDSSLDDLLPIKSFCGLRKGHTLTLVKENLAPELGRLGAHSRMTSLVVEIVRVNIFLVHRQQVFVQHCARIKLRHEH